MVPVASLDLVVELSTSLGESVGLVEGEEEAVEETGVSSSVVPEDDGLVFEAEALAGEPVVMTPMVVTCNNCLLSKPIKRVGFLGWRYCLQINNRGGTCLFIFDHSRAAWSSFALRDCKRLHSTCWCYC